MEKYLIKRKIDTEICENNKKIAIYAGIGIAALGAYFSYKTYKRIKSNQEEIQYIDNENYEINNLKIPQWKISIYIGKEIKCQVPWLEK